MTDRTLISGVSTQMLARIVSLIVAASITPFLARSLGAADYGTFALASTVVAVASTIGDAGLGLLASRELLSTKDRASWISSFWTSRVILGIVVTLVAIGATAFMDDRTILWIALLSLPGLMIIAGATALFMADLDPQRAGVVEVVTRIVFAVTFIGGVLAGASIVELFALSTAVTLVAGVMAARYAKRHGVGFAWNEEWATLARRALPLGLLPVLGMIYSRSDLIVLYALRTEVEVGMYAVGWKVLEAWVALTSVIAGLAIPVFSKDRSASAITVAARALGMASLIGGSVTAVLARPVVAIVGGPEFLEPVVIGSRTVDSVQALTIVMMAFGLMGFNLIAGSGLLAFSLERLLYRHFAIVVTINLGLAVFLVPTWSLVGAAIASLVSEAAALIHVAWSARHDFTVINGKTLAWAVGTVAISVLVALPFRATPDLVAFLAVPAVSALLAVAWPIRRWLTEALEQNV